MNELTRQEMIRKGYRDPTEREAFLYERAGSENYWLYFQSMFRAATMEADFLEIRRGTKQWNFVLTERFKAGINLLAEVYESVNADETVRFTPLTDEQIKRDIEKKYRDLEKKLKQRQEQKKLTE